MGHAHITTTMIYVHHRPRHDDAAKLGAHVATEAAARPHVPDSPPNFTANFTADPALRAA